MRLLPLLFAQDDSFRLFDGLRQGDKTAWITLGVIVLIFVVIFIIKARQPD